MASVDEVYRCVNKGRIQGERRKALKEVAYIVAGLVTIAWGAVLLFVVLGGGV
jgi:hypothetical protein